VVWEKEKDEFNLILLLAIISSGCITISEAPGCNGGLLKSMFAGGCFGTHIIRNLTIEPTISCLKIYANNCDDGVLEIASYCSEPVTIAGIKMEERRGSNGTFLPAILVIDPVRTSSGEIIVNTSASYKPSFDDFITINGTVGNTTIKISYIKTKSLC